MKYISLFCLLVCSFPALSQSNDETAVRAVIDRLFTGMRKADSSMVQSVFLPTSTLTSVSMKKSVMIQETAIAKFVTSIGRQKPGSLDERLASYDIKTEPLLATAWTPYVFYLNGKKSHCGVNTFTLVKMDDKWYIHSIIDTRRTETCPDLP
ncbi:hypothetical protein [Spirosoma sp. KUDC1026]|uniref:hypothetical protein n=1 Tax=Spirosoma sp. KUDC1026 TaxID=2745947 RepID=UPI00159BED52|nr:hypothetical protein [Spirosoma sp. KUDC1026]QKZ11336.1 hypothetical protein HU175_01260 [Spirosoma sp. KUDC1026]